MNLKHMYFKSGDLSFTAHDVEIIRRQARAQGDHDEQIENDKLRVVVDNYEHLINHVQAESSTAQDTLIDELSAAIIDRDTLQDDIKRLDHGYNDLQRRYMRLRTVVEDMRSNEMRMRHMCVQYEQRLRNEHERYRGLVMSSNHELTRYDDS